MAGRTGNAVKIRKMVFLLWAGKSGKRWHF